MEANNEQKYLTLLPTGRLVPLSHDQTVLECLLSHGIAINHSCGGNGTCGTCRIYIPNFRDLSLHRNELEQEMAIDRGFSESEKLACQTEVADKMRIQIP